MKASIRINSLTLGGPGPKTLSAMELHGKRLDKSSQERRVSDRDPLVFGSLDLREAYESHVAGAHMNKALKRPVMHALVQFPKELTVTEKLEKQMLAHAIKFIDATHGGQAVFAARLDRDEKGRHTVDVFFTPKYEKKTKSKGVEVWISTSKHGKELARKHEAKIRARHPNSTGPLTGPRHVGIALQEELGEYLTSFGLKLEPRLEKKNSRLDRVDPEVFKARKDAEDALAEAEELKKKMLDREKLLENIQVREQEVLRREKLVDQTELSFKKTFKRLRSLMTMMSEKLGITVPLKISDALNTLETEAYERERAWSAVERSSSTEDPFDEARPGL